MDPRPYTELSELELLALCVWREARNQRADGMAAVAWSIRNRVQRPSWWGHDYPSVILKPWQYSSFNLSDPNSTKWPADNDESWPVCMAVVTPIYQALITSPDPTGGATHYYDTSITFPKAWGRESEWENTLNLHQLRFWKMRPPNTHDDVQEALTAE